MIIRPAHTYPCTFKGSSSEIEFMCDDHQGRLICGSARRTGLTVIEEWPVYALHSFVHPAYNDILVALSPDGFVLLPVYTISEQEPKPNRTPFIACILENSKVPYDFDPHPIAWWMYTKGDLVQAVNRQVSGIRYVTPEKFQICCVLAGYQDGAEDKEPQSDVSPSSCIRRDWLIENGSPYLPERSKATIQFDKGYIIFERRGKRRVHDPMNMSSYSYGRIWRLRAKCTLTDYREKIYTYNK